LAVSRRLYRRTRVVCLAPPRGALPSTLPESCRNRCPDALIDALS